MCHGEVCAGTCEHRPGDARTRRNALIAVLYALQPCDRAVYNQDEGRKHECNARVLAGLCPSRRAHGARMTSDHALALSCVPDLPRIGLAARLKADDPELVARAIPLLDTAR